MSIFQAIELMADGKCLLNKDIAIESSDIDSDLQALRFNHSNMQERYIHSLHLQHHSHIPYLEN